VWVGDPSQASRSDSGDAVCDAVARAEFFCAVFEEADQSPVDVAEAEEAEVVGRNSDSSRQLEVGATHLRVFEAA
jgi:hypothetical protein